MSPIRSFRQPLELLKLHGMGNDFLVLLDADGSHPVNAYMARSLCDRHFGVGADGLIRARTGASAVRMELFNSDGSRAETSGNGLRCLALALALVADPAPSGGWEGDFLIETEAGLRRARVEQPDEDGEALVTVGMGRAVLGPELTVAGRRARLVDLGNPHLVVEVDDPASVDLEVEGPAEETRHSGGINVNYAAADGRGGLRLRTWERGAGSTLACGSGSCASAAAFREWGLVGDRVQVSNPGGPVTVGFDTGDPGEGASVAGGAEIVLSAPARLVAVVQVEGGHP